MKPPVVACVDFVELATEWMEGALDEDQRSEIEEHLVVCPPCIAFVRQLRLTQQALGTLQDAPLPPAARDRLLEAFAEWSGRGRA